MSLLPKRGPTSKLFVPVGTLRGGLGGFLGLSLFMLDSII